MSGKPLLPLSLSLSLSLLILFQARRTLVHELTCTHTHTHTHTYSHTHSHTHTHTHTHMHTHTVTHTLTHTHTHMHTHTVTHAQLPRLHEFVWHGADPSEPGRFIPRKNTFTQFRHVPAQIYVNVRDVRTNDDTLITVKLMVFYELKDIERMVSRTNIQWNLSIAVTPGTAESVLISEVFSFQG